MTDSPITTSLDDLLKHREWVRGVARSMLGDDATAEDVVQDTYLAALRYPPSPNVPRRAWLAKVGRNFARMVRRSSGRRTFREQAVRRDAVAPAAADLVEQASMHRIVVEAVLALDEPYRSTVLMRFFADLQPQEIAVQLGIPAATVRVRLMRALEQLKARLESHVEGGRDAWRAGLLLLLAPGHTPPPGPGTGAAIELARTSERLLSTKSGAIIAAALMLIALPVIGFWAIDDGARTATNARPTSESDATQAEVATTPPPVSEPPPPFLGVATDPIVPSPFVERAAVFACGNFDSKKPVPPITVSVVSDDFKPLSGVALSVDGRRIGNTAADGTLSVDRDGTVIRAGQSVVWVDHPDFAPARARIPGIETRLEMRLRPSGALRFKLVDENGIPVADARAEVFIGWEGFGGVDPLASGTASPTGEILLERLPIDRVTAWITARGFCEQFLEVHGIPGTTTERTVKLEHSRRVTLRLRQEDGAPIAGATVDPSWHCFGLRFPQYVTDASGIAVIDGVPRSEVDMGLLIGVDHGGAHDRRLHLDAGGDVVREIVWESTGLDIRVVSSSWSSSSASILVYSGQQLIRMWRPANDGSLKITGIPANKQLAVELEIGGLVVARVPDTEQFPGLVLAPGEMRQLQLQAPEIVAVGLRLVDGGGATVTGVIRLIANDAMSFSLMVPPRKVTLKSDPDGYFRFAIPRGTYKYDVEVNGRELLNDQVLVVDQPAKLDVVVVSGSVIAGRILDGRRQPLAGWAITARAERSSSWARSAPDGTFRIEGLDPRAHRIFVTAPTWTGGAQIGGEIIGGTTGLELVVPLTPIRFRVQNLETGKATKLPISIRFLTGSGHSEIPPPAILMPDAAGQATLELPDGEYDATATDEQKLRPQAVKFAVPAAATGTVTITI